MQWQRHKTYIKVDQPLTPFNNLSEIPASVKKKNIKKLIAQTFIWGEITIVHAYYTFRYTDNASEILKKEVFIV